jgi:hypothetical protein
MGRDDPFEKHKHTQMHRWLFRCSRLHLSLFLSLGGEAILQ